MRKQARSAESSRTLPARLSRAPKSPRLSNLDLSLFKTFIREGLRLQARGEFFNAFNSPMFGQPNPGFGSGNFGRITSQTNDPRQVQLALRLIF